VSQKQNFSALIWLKLFLRERKATKQQEDGKQNNNSLFFPKHTSSRHIHIHILSLSLSILLSFSPSITILLSLSLSQSLSVFLSLPLSHTTKHSDENWFFRAILILEAKKAENIKKFPPTLSFSLSLSISLSPPTSLSLFLRGIFCVIALSISRSDVFGLVVHSVDTVPNID